MFRTHLFGKRISEEPIHIAHREVPLKRRLESVRRDRRSPPRRPPDR